MRSPHNFKIEAAGPGQESQTQTSGKFGASGAIMV